MKPVIIKPALYAHPFASYCWKVLVALYENDTAFIYRSLVCSGVLRWPERWTRRGLSDGTFRWARPIVTE